MAVSRLRAVLVLGFGGLLVIFSLAAVDAVRLLTQLRGESRTLRDASVDRSRRLSSVRSCILLSHSYIRDYLVDPDDARVAEHSKRLEELWIRLDSDLRGYRAATLAEARLLLNLQELLEQHWRELSDVMRWPDAMRRRRGAAFYTDRILPRRTSILEVETRIDDVNERQIARTEAVIEQQFEQLGRRLTITLLTGLCVALLLAGGSMFYILRIENDNRRRYRELAKSRDELERLSARLVSVQEQERRTLSRELHDEVGQALSALLVDTANLAKRFTPGDEEVQGYLSSIRGLANRSVNSIRDIALLLRPSMLDDLGLVPALEWHAREVSRRSGVSIKVTEKNLPDSLPDPIRTCVYRVSQEALQNIARHSQAKSVALRVEADEHEIILEVEDDGVGFNPGRTRGLGILGMEERVRQLGGRLEFLSASGNGTRLRAAIPLDTRATG